MQSEAEATRPRCELKTKELRRTAQGLSRSRGWNSAPEALQMCHALLQHRPAPPQSLLHDILQGAERHLGDLAILSDVMLLLLRMVQAEPSLPCGRGTAGQLMLLACRAVHARLRDAQAATMRSRALRLFGLLIPLHGQECTVQHMELLMALMREGSFSEMASAAMALHRLVGMHPHQKARSVDLNIVEAALTALQLATAHSAEAVAALAGLLSELLYRFPPAAARAWGAGGSRLLLGALTLRGECVSCAVALCVALGNLFGSAAADEVGDQEAAWVLDAAMMNFGFHISDPDAVMTACSLIFNISTASPALEERLKEHLPPLLSSAQRRHELDGDVMRRLQQLWRRVDKGRGAALLVPLF